MVAARNFTMTENVSDSAKLNNELSKRGLSALPGLNWGWLNSATKLDLWHYVQDSLGFPLKNSQTDVMTIPYLDTEGNEILQGNGKPYVRYRLQNPDLNDKYQSPVKSGLHLYFSPTISPQKWEEVKRDKTIPLILVEGEVKAEYLNQMFLKAKKPIAYAIGLAGIWGWVVGKDKISKNKGLGYLLEAISGASHDGMKKALTRL